ncbi:MAG: DMT family transporter, partial [Anaerolineae bacterium]|nr:DMT family transporter [Anaerolineae bacterium]
STGQLTFAFIYILPFSLIIDQPFTLEPSTRAIVSWVILALFGTVIAYNIYYMLLERTNATFTVSVTYIVPIFGLILGALVLDETLSAMIIVSSICILTGILLVRVKDKKIPVEFATTDTFTS